MRKHSMWFVAQMEVMRLSVPFKLFIVLVIIFSCIGHRISCHCRELSSPAPAPHYYSSLSITAPIQIACKFARLIIEGKELDEATVDYGNITHYKRPLAVIHPSSVSDILCVARAVFEQAKHEPQLAITARGAAHSVRGQAQAPGPGGMVLSMRSQIMKPPPMQVVNRGKTPYVDVYAGELWVNVLNKTLNHGLSPRSWTDYLYLTVGGTLSNAGVSGQTFRYGPQISNVLQLQVVTGKGELLTCSEKQNADLFNAVLGGLGQFGIITRARIALQPAPQLVKWITASYTNFSAFCKDQEYLISLPSGNSFDYVEGFVMINTPKQPLYNLEVVKYFNPQDRNLTEQIVERLLSTLSFIPSTLNITEASYFQFLDRVHTSELNQRAQGLWEVPHPWLNLQIAKSKIHIFAEGVFGNIVRDTSSGIIIFYPVFKSKWNNRTSAVTPDGDGDVIYLVAFLFAAVPPGEEDVVNRFLNQNQRILEFCETAQLGVKQYLAYYNTTQEWEAHFGPQRWGAFQNRKSTYDPLAILAPAQLIFSNKS